MFVKLHSTQLQTKQFTKWHGTTGNNAPPKEITPNLYSASTNIRQKHRHHTQHFSQICSLNYFTASCPHSQEPNTDNSYKSAKTQKSASLGRKRPHKRTGKKRRSSVGRCQSADDFDALEADAADELGALRLPTERLNNHTQLCKQLSEREVKQIESNGNRGIYLAAVGAVDIAYIVA